MIIAATVTENEGRALSVAVEQLRRLLAQVSQRDWNIECDLLAIASNPEIRIISLLPEVESDEPIDRVKQRLREHLNASIGAGGSVFLCTIFRACNGDASKLERIRRLNLVAPALSHELDAGVIDLDRMLSDIGAQQLQTDFRLDGPAAREVTAYTIVKTLLAGGFDDRIPDETVERARSMADRAYGKATQ
ncbi:MAG: hypothetical protein ACREML_05985 [Vulcanimicrobiaceae bacterium]